MSKQFCADKGHWAVVSDLQRAHAIPWVVPGQRLGAEATGLVKGWLYSSFCLKMKTLQLIPGHAFDLQITLSRFLFNLLFIS